MTERESEEVREGKKRVWNDKQSHSACKSLHSFIQLSTKSRLEVLISCNQNKERQRGFGVFVQERVLSLGLHRGPPLSCWNLCLEYYMEEASWLLVTHTISPIDRFREQVRISPPLCSIPLQSSLICFTAFHNVPPVFTTDCFLSRLTGLSSSICTFFTFSCSFVANICNDL